MSKNQSYSPEFRAEAVKLVLEQGLSREAAANRLGIPKGTLRNWMAVAKSGNSAKPRARSVVELEVENARLRKALAAARVERDIVKKAAAYFAKESLRSTRS